MHFTSTTIILLPELDGGRCGMSCVCVWGGGGRPVRGGRRGRAHYDCSLLYSDFNHAEAKMMSTVMT